MAGCQFDRGITLAKQKLMPRKLIDTLPFFSKLDTEREAEQRLASL